MQLMHLSQVHCVVVGEELGAGWYGGTWEMLFLPPAQLKL